MQHRTKGINEVFTYEVEFARALETIWKPANEYAATQYVRPVTINGFEYECTDAGQSGSQEPDWPTTIGETINDGSVEWTCRDFASNATDSIQTHTVVADTGLTIDSSTISGTRIDVTVSGGTLGRSYDMAVRANTTAGSVFVETVRITITE